MDITPETLQKAIHDLKTPLTSINCFLELLESRLPDDAYNSYILKIKTAYQQLLRQINVLHWLIKLENDSLVFSNQPMRLREAVESAVMEMINKNKFTHVNVDVHVDRTHVIKSDIIMFRQFIDTLIGEFVQDGCIDSISISSKRLPDRMIELCIGKDVDESGQIKTEIQEQEDSLPFALSKKIVRAHGGNIWLFINGHDKCFHSTFPESY